MKLDAADDVPNPADSPGALKSATSPAASRMTGGSHAGPAALRTFASVEEIVCESAAMKNIMATVRRIAPFDASVLLQGESGSGKEVIARALHRLSPRHRREFVPVNCAALSGEILENELFGHERGAFTSANERKIGMLEVADGGTLLLDEINEMSLSVQAKLLRVLERRAFRRLGGTKRVNVDLRILAATNVDLEAEVAARRFRDDLYYRLKVITISIPPLRERREDIPALARQFLHQVGDHDVKASRFSEHAISRLMSYVWPGNVRELKNVVESMALMTTREIIDLRDLPANIRSAASPLEFTIRVGMTMADIEREVFLHYLQSYPTKTAVAQALGIGVRTLHAKVKKYRLPRHGTPQ